ncbi:glycosyltransferase [Roseateles sp. BYS180W]|uniref:Glycosyltransferase n=1 Tax=Roseateles rivi TaxID=3299028 RepID=A0ABW7FRR1_9BURK
MKTNIVCFTGNSGLTDYSVSLCKALGEKARLITSTQIEPRFTQMGFEVQTLFRRSRHYPLDILKFMGFALRHRHEHYIFQGPLKFPLVDGLVLRLLRLFGVRATVTVHDVLPHYPNALSKFTFAFYYKSFNQYIAHSERASTALQAMGLRQPKLVVPHGVYDLFKLSAPSRAEARSRLGLPDEGLKLVLFFGHVETRKGALAFAQLAKRFGPHERVKFLIAGKSSLSPAEEQSLADSAKEAGNLEFHNQRIPFEAVENYFAAADVVALPYLEGTTSGVLKLALAFARPVLATDVGDFKEQIGQKYGLCVPMNENMLDALEQGLRSLLLEQARWEASCRAETADMQWPHIAKRVSTFVGGE